MKKTKYVMSGGLAFSEEKDLAKLNDLAKKGWILEKFAFLGFKLRKAEPQNLIYNLDYRIDADEEYFQFFKEAGWKPILSSDEIHIFCAPEGTNPIHTDRQTIIEKYEMMEHLFFKWATRFLFLLLPFIIIEALSYVEGFPTIIRNISFYIGLVPFFLLIFTGLPYLGYRSKLKEVRSTRVVSKVL